MRSTLRPRSSTSTWRERSASTCLPCAGYFALNAPLARDQPAEDVARGDPDPAPAAHLAVGDDGPPGRRVEAAGARDGVAQVGEAALQQPHGRPAGARRGGGRDADHALGLRDERHLLGRGAVAGAHGQAALAGLERDEEGAVRARGLDQHRLRGQLGAALVEPDRDPLPGDERRDGAAHPQLVAAQDDLVRAEAVDALELERHRPGAASGAGAGVGVGRRRRRGGRRRWRHLGRGDGGEAERQQAADDDRGYPSHRARHSTRARGEIRKLGASRITRHE